MVKMIAATIVFILLACVMHSQVVDTTGLAENPAFNQDPTVAILLEWYHYLYGALVIVWGYIAKVFNRSQKIPFIFVVVAGAAVIGGAFYVLGFSKVFPLIFSFLGAIGIYDIILKPAKRLVQQTPTTE